VGSNTKKVSHNDAKSEVKKPPLFIILSILRALAQDEVLRSDPSLIRISRKSNDKNGTDSEQSPKRPALFAIPGTNRKQISSGTELSESDETRPKKAMKRALFDIPAWSKEK
jgi:hypothetical protein